MQKVSLATQEPLQVRDLICNKVCPNDITKCVATAVMRNNESFRMSGDTVWSMRASSGLMNQFSTVAPFLSDPGFQFLPLGWRPCVKPAFPDGRCITVERPHPSLRKPNGVICLAVVLRRTDASDQSRLSVDDSIGGK